MLFGSDDYIDADVSYLIGLIVSRGTISEIHGIRQITIEFPYSLLEAQGITSSFDQEIAIRLGIYNVQERLRELLDTEIATIKTRSNIQLVIRFMHESMAWRNVLAILEGATSYRSFGVPRMFFDADLPIEYKREFMRGFADVAGNIRHANRYKDGRHRVRLDVLNSPSNWELPVQLCTLMQEHLGVPVQLITWGHPNMGRDFREHQINVFAELFLKIGFSFVHKQRILEEFAQSDRKECPNATIHPCPGERKLRDKKPCHAGERNDDRLDPRLVGNHYDGYWQICKALGCKRVPRPSEVEIDFVDDTSESSSE